jgi:hypothetical protein
MALAVTDLFLQVSVLLLHYKFYVLHSLTFTLTRTIRILDSLTHSLILYSLTHSLAAVSGSIFGGPPAALAVPKDGGLFGASASAAAPAANISGAAPAPESKSNLFGAPGLSQSHGGGSSVADQYNEAFAAKFDKVDGDMDVEDFQAVLRSLGHNPAEGELQKLLNTLAGADGGDGGDDGAANGSIGGGGNGSIGGVGNGSIGGGGNGSIGGVGNGSIGGRRGGGGGGNGFIGGGGNGFIGGGGNRFIGGGGNGFIGGGDGNDADEDGDDEEPMSCSCGYHPIYDSDGEDSDDEFEDDEDLSDQIYVADILVCTDNLHSHRSPILRSGKGRFKGCQDVAHLMWRSSMKLKLEHQPGFTKEFSKCVYTPRIVIKGERRKGRELRPKQEMLRRLTALFGKYTRADVRVPFARWLRTVIRSLGHVMKGDLESLRGTNKWEEGGVERTLGGTSHAEGVHMHLNKQFSRKVSYLVGLRIFEIFICRTYLDQGVKHGRIPDLGSMDIVTRMRMVLKEKDLVATSKANEYALSILDAPPKDTDCEWRHATDTAEIHGHWRAVMNIEPAVPSVVRAVLQKSRRQVRSLEELLERSIQPLKHLVGRARLLKLLNFSSEDDVSKPDWNITEQSVLIRIRYLQRKADRRYVDIFACIPYIYH